MRKYFLTAFVLAATLVFATSGLALEKTALRVGEGGRLDDWNAGTSCTIQYYNICTGWLWIWSGWSANDCLGTCFDNCCLPSPGFLSQTAFYVWTAAPSGYGFTGTATVNEADGQCCPGTELGAQVFFPISGWNTYTWNTEIAGDAFVVKYQLGPTPGTPIVIPTDHPAAGPTGPQACGTCYPLDRESRSFYYGPECTLCPGSGLNDGVCDAELWHVAAMSCVISVEEESWGSIKNLYR
jgi:hypothetical protein